MAKIAFNMDLFPNADYTDTFNEYTVENGEVTFIPGSAN